MGLFPYAGPKTINELAVYFGPSISKSKYTHERQLRKRSKRALDPPAQQTDMRYTSWTSAHVFPKLI